MESYVRSASVQLWRVFEDGFKPQDPKNLTPQEVIDEQLDAMPKYMLMKVMTDEDVDQVRSFKTAKEAWDFLDTLHEGNSSIQRSKKVVLQHEVDNFAMLNACH